MWNLLNERKLTRFDHNQHPIWLHSEFSLPEKGWLFGEFAEGLKERQALTGMDRYVAERNPCGVFALGALVYMSEVHLQSTGKATGMAFGMVCYTRDWDKDPAMGEPARRRHAINLALVRNGPTWDDLEFVFFEPQNRTQVFLTDSEIGSITDTII